MIHDFVDKFEFSLGKREQFDMELLKESITGCVDIKKTDEETDKAGVDYIATLRRGAKVLVDAKARDKGASKYWKNGEPELALEIWSVCPSENSEGKVGWTLNENSEVDLILYTFDPSDCNSFYLIPFQNLRLAFIKNFREWKSKYGVKEQESKKEESGKNWTSKAIFVPASVVIRSVSETMTGQTRR